MRREYLSHIGRPVRTLAVCSDATAGHVDIERDPNLASDPTRDTGQVRAAEIGCRVAQNAEAVADWLRGLTTREALSWLVYGVTLAGARSGATTAACA